MCEAQSIGERQGSRTHCFHELNRIITKVSLTVWEDRSGLIQWRASFESHSDTTETYRWVKERSRQAESLKQLKRKTVRIISLLLAALRHGLLTILDILIPRHLIITSTYKQTHTRQGTQEEKNKKDNDQHTLVTFDVIYYRRHCPSILEGNDQNWTLNMEEQFLFKLRKVAYVNEKDKATSWEKRTREECQNK